MKINFYNNFNNHSSGFYIQKKSEYNVTFSNNPKNSVPVYLVDKNGNFKRYNSLSDASVDIGYQSCSLKKANAHGKRIAGFAVIMASDVEEIGKNGIVSVNQQKINLLNKIPDGALPPNCVISKKNSLNHPIYVLSQNAFKKYNSVEEASKILNIPFQRILNYSNTLLVDGTDGGYIFIRPNKIENKKSDGTVEINKQFIEKLIKTRDAKKILDITKEGYKISSRGKSILQEVKLGAETVRRALDDKNFPIIAGHIFANLLDFEYLDENYNILLDEEKIKVLIEKIKKRESFKIE